MWWYKKHDVPISVWAYYPWYKALRYAPYQDWRYDFPDAMSDVVHGVADFWKGVFTLLSRSVQWVFSPILKSVRFIRVMPDLRKSIEAEREGNQKKWLERVAKSNK